MTENVKLDSYRLLTEDEFELETMQAPDLPGPRLLEEQAEILERAAEGLRALATLWRASV